MSGLLTRRHVRWPRWGPRPSPKQFCGFESRHANRVLWIIGSTDRHLIQLFHPRHQRALPTATGERQSLSRASSRPMPDGPSRCSITSESPRRFDRLQFRKVEIANRPQYLGRCAVLLIVGQCIQPGGIFCLKLREPCDGVVPALDARSPVYRASCAHNRRTNRTAGTIPRLTFGAGHGSFTDRWTRHRCRSMALDGTAPPSGVRSGDLRSWRAGVSF